MTETRVEGAVMVCWKDPQKAHREDLATYSLRDFTDTGSTPEELEKDKRPIMPYYAGGKKFLPKDYLTVDVESSVGTSIHYAEGSPAGVSRVRIPMTAYNRRTGGKSYPIVIGNRTVPLMTMDSVATYTTIVVGTRKEFGYYQIPDGLEMVLGQKNAFNSRISLFLMTHT